MKGSSSGSGFSLLEVLVAVAIIALLGAIVSGVGRGVRERAAVSRARGELAVMARALEDYRATHGDYPQIKDGVSGATTLYRALMGTRDPAGRPLSASGAHPAMVDRATLTVGSVPSPERVGEGSSEPAFFDPWGNAYIYAYKRVAGDEWERRGYLLLSLGPSGRAGVEGGPAESGGIPGSGMLPSNYREGEGAHDNILAQP